MTQKAYNIYSLIFDSLPSFALNYKWEIQFTNSRSTCGRLGCQGGNQVFLGKSGERQTTTCLPSWNPAQETEKHLWGISFWHHESQEVEQRVRRQRGRGFGISFHVACHLAPVPCCLPELDPYKKRGSKYILLSLS